MVLVGGAIYRTAGLLRHWRRIHRLLYPDPLSNLISPMALRSFRVRLLPLLVPTILTVFTLQRCLAQGKSESTGLQAGGGMGGGMAPASGPAGAGGPAVCPEVTTADNIELSSYTGEWYEVSVSARFKLRNEAGLRCDKARYTLGAPGSAGPVVQVQNSGLYVTSPPFVGAINDVAAGNRNSCRASDGISRELAAFGTLCGPQIVTRMRLHNGELRAYVGQLTQNLLLLAQGGVNTSQIPVQVAAAEGLSRQVQGHADAIATEADRAAKGGGMGRGMPPVDALRRIADLARNIIQAQGSVQRALQGLPEAAVGNAPPGAGIPTSISATATVDPAHQGRLTVTFPFQPPPPTPNYLILDLVGDRRRNYTAALVYSCAEEEPGYPPRNTAYLLSREPTLPLNVQQEFSDRLDRNGIVLDCDNVLVTSLQTGC